MGKDEHFSATERSWRPSAWQGRWWPTGRHSKGGIRAWGKLVLVTTRGVSCNGFSFFFSSSLLPLWLQLLFLLLFPLRSGFSFLKRGASCYFLRLRKRSSAFFFFLTRGASCYF